MSTTIASLVADLKTDYGLTLEDAVARRAILRATTFLNSDLSLSFVVSGAEPSEVIDPELIGAFSIYRELILLRALAYTTRIKRTANASGLSIRSADKSISRSVTGWMSMERDLLLEYWDKIKKINPDMADNVILVDGDISVCSRGSATDEDDTAVDVNYDFNE